jgi:NAD(P)-dependent dehydrogenase (short-subunit alcohol dehydrogenase family)
VKTAVVVGANRGIGLALCQALKARGDSVIAACRRAGKDLPGLGVEVMAGVDVTSDQAVARFAAALRGRSIDSLIVVAGVLESVRLGDLRFDSIRSQLEINALGPLRVVTALLDEMPIGSKIGLLTSRMGSIADNTSGGHYGYRMSKAALNMAGRSLALDIRERGVALAILHPGFVRTDMTGGQGNVDAGEAAAQLIARMDELTMATSGRFVHANGDALPW